MPAVTRDVVDPRWLARGLRLREVLLAWYGSSGRDLPWRGTSDPYAVLVSELMAQQTQISRAALAWPRFIAAFPSVQALATASTGDVVAAWRGLGYNRRAVNLQRAARSIVDDHGGVVPSEIGALEALSGVGPYTARAVAAFAYGVPAAPVDTNVARVLARAVVGGPLSRRDTQRLADALVPPESAARWSQALMDLGATSCRARGPDCVACPLVSSCAWRGGDGGVDPAAGSAHASRRQGVFAGSDRWHRGRLVDALRDGPVGGDGLARAARLPGDAARLERIIDALVGDGLAVRRPGGGLALPGGPEAPDV